MHAWMHACMHVCMHVYVYACICEGLEIFMHLQCRVITWTANQVAAVSSQGTIQRGRP